ncbi:hypothetical protein DsansV1_C07g0073701 [Dioscorea sansibarensis]
MMAYHLVSFIVHILIVLLAVSFLWCKSSSFQKLVIFLRLDIPHFPFPKLSISVVCGKRNNFIIILEK